MGVLSELPWDDWVTSQYTGSARTWASVTPVLLPGSDDRDSEKTRRLIWQAFEQAGLPPEALVGGTAERRPVGFWPGTAPARNYLPPDKLSKWPRYHVWVRFARPVAGPLAVGVGRYRGFGLFAALDDR